MPASRQTLDAQIAALKAAGAERIFSEKQSGAKTDRAALAKARRDRLAKSTRACLHSPCPEDGGDEVDDGGEAFVGLLVAGGNASKGLYAAEEVFDEMPPLVF